MSPDNFVDIRTICDFPKLKVAALIRCFITLQKISSTTEFGRIVELMKADPLLEVLFGSHMLMM